MTQRIGLEAALEMAGWTRNVDRYMSDLDRMNSGTSSTARGLVGSFDGLGKKVIGTGALLGGALVAGATAAGAAMGGVIVKGSQMAAAMEAQVSGIVAVLDTSLKAAGVSSADAIGMLNEQILSLSIDPSLKVDAVQAASAIEMLARNGLSLTEITGGAAKSTVLLANATSADFSTAADIATDVMALFNIEAANMSEAVNGITSVVNNSKFGIEDYQLALAQGGGVAASVGVEFADFNSTIAAISPYFAAGSDAGTSFKTMLQRLSPTTKPAREAMAELGLLTEEGNSRFYDAQGNMRSMADISAILATATANLSEEQKNVALSTIFGTDAMRAAFGLAASGEVIYTDVEEAAKALGLSHEELADAMEGGLTQYEALQLTMQRTDAEEAAKTRIDNFAGALEIMQGVIDAVMLQIGQKFLPVWRSMAETFTKFVEENGPAIVDFFGLLAGWLADRIPTAVNAVVGAMKTAAGVVSEFVKGASQGGTLLESVLAGIEEVLNNFLTEDQMAVVKTINDNIQALAATISGALSTALQFVSDHAAEFAGALAGIAAVLATAAMVTTIFSLAAAIGALFTPMGLIIAGAALLGAAWAGNWGGIQEKTQAVIDAITPYIDKAVAWLNENIPMALTAMQTKWNEVWPAIQATGEAAWTTITTAWANASTWLETNIPAALTTLQTKWGEVWPAILSTFASAWLTITTAWANASTWLETNIPTAITTLQTKWNEVWPAIQTTGETVWTAITAAWTTATTWLETNIPTALSTLQTKWNEIWPLVQSTGETVWTTLTTAWTTATTWLETTIPTALTTLQTKWDEVWPLVQSTGEAVWTTLTTAWTTATTWLETNIPTALTTLQTKWNEVWPLIQTTAETVWATLTTAWTTATTWLETNIPTALTTLQTKWDEVWPLVQSTAETVWTAITTAWTTATTWLETTLPTALTNLQTKWGEVWPALQTSNDTVWTAISTAWTNASTWLETTIPTALTNLQTTWETVSTALQSAWQLFTDFFGPTIDNLVAGFTSMVEGMAPVGGKLEELWTVAQPVLTKLGFAIGVVAAAINLIFLAAFRAILDVVAAVMPQVDDIVIGVIDALIKGFQMADEALEALERVFRENWPAIERAVRQAWERISEWLTQAQEWFETKLPGYLDTLAEAFRLSWENMKTNVSQTWEDIRKIFDVVGIWLRVTLPGWLSMMATKWQDAWTTATGAVTGAWDTIKSAFESIKEWLEVTLQNAFGSFKTFIENFSIPNPFAGILGTVTSLLEKIPGLNSLLGSSGRNISRPIPGENPDQMRRRTYEGDLSAILSASLGVAGGFSGVAAEDIRKIQEEAAKLDASILNQAKILEAVKDTEDPAIIYQQRIYNDLLERRNKLEREMMGIQHGIDRADSVQQQVSFLQKQNDLLDIIEDRGLDVEKILGGIDPKAFGANADPRQLLFLSNRISEALAKQMEAELRIRAQTIEERAAQEERRRQIETALSAFEASRIEFVKQLSTLSSYGGIANMFNADVLEGLAGQIETIGGMVDSALSVYEQSGLDKDLEYAKSLETDRLQLIQQYRVELQKVQRVQATQNATQRLKAQAELLERARELGIESATWDIQFGANASTQDLLKLVEVITNEENRRALFDLENIRLFKDLDTDLGLSGTGASIFDNFKARVLDPIWAQLQDMGKTLDERFGLVLRYRKEQERILAINRMQEETGFLEAQAELLQRAQEMGLQSFTWDVNFGRNADPGKLLDLVAAINKAENEKALFDLQNLRIFQGLTNELDVSGEGGSLAGTFKTTVLDPLWAQMHDITKSEEERYMLAQQYRREQEKILRLQQAQSQLDFLQQQMDLIKLVADNGLDAASIFQGLEFGVNASIDDLIAAVTRAVEAMVGQVEKDLDMHSPSRVMRRLGMMAMAGFTGGIESLTRGPAQAVRRSMSGMMTTAGATVRNVNMNMGGVNINNGMSEALFQARVSQSIRRSI